MRLIAKNDFQTSKMAEKDDKFAHLLQPIRDLASNWNIDIANELEEYMVRYIGRCCFPEASNSATTLNCQLC